MRRGPRRLSVGDLLHVLQGSDGSVAPAAATLVQSDQGSGMSGACVGATAVMFPDDLAAFPASTSFVVPAACTRVLVTGLSPGAGYAVARSDVSGGRRITVTAEDGQAANALGVVESN